MKKYLIMSLAVNVATVGFSALVFKRYYELHEKEVERATEPVADPTILS